MDFLRPAFLWGLLGVSLPILIHLIGRRRVRTVPVATLRFLERARARDSSTWRIRRWLLLAARMAVLGCLALLYAGPGCTAPGAGSGAATWALVLDTSPSMAAKRAGRSALDRAKARLLEVLARAGPEDRFLLLTTRAAGPGGEMPEVTAEPDRVRRAVEQAAVEYGRHRLDRAVSVARARVQGEPGPRVVVATDLQASAWPGGPAGGPEEVPVYLLDCGWDGAANTWVDAVGEGPDGLEVRVGRSGEPGAVTVRVVLPPDRDLTAFLDPGRSRARFEARPGADGAVVVARVSPGGDLALDDALPVPLRGASRPSVLLVNGDPRGFRIRDELLFVRKALAPGTRLAGRFRVREVRQGDLGPRDLEGVDVVVLANPGPLEPEVRDAIRSRVEEGAGLLVSAGDHLSADGQDGIGELLPAPLRDRVEVPQNDPTRPPYETLDPESLSGPLEAFRDPRAGDLTATRVRRYWVLDTRAAAGLSVWARLGNGAPLLVEARRGRGRILFLGTTLDRDGADLCLQPGFVPWVERVLLYAAGRLRPRVAPVVLAGEPVDLPYREPVVVEGPGGRAVRWAPGDEPFVAPEPGLYRVSAGEGWTDRFAARVSPGESDLTRLDARALAARLGPGGFTVLGEGGIAAGPADGVPGRTDASVPVAAALLGALALEALLSARWRRR